MHACVRLKTWYNGLVPVLLLNVTEESPSVAAQSQQRLTDAAMSYPGTAAVRLGSDMPVLSKAALSSQGCLVSTCSRPLMLH